MARGKGLPYAWSRVVHAWDAAQVELHGCYSVQRMIELSDYIKHTSSTRTLLVILLTPVPCLLAVAFADCIPLRDPREGMGSSIGFWVRATFATWVYTYSILEQLRCFMPKLPLTGWIMLGLSIPVVVGANGVLFALAWRVAYPMPFTIPVITCPWCVFMVLTLRLYLRAYLRDNPETMKELLHFSFVTCCQMSMLVVYPAYNAAFYRLSSTAQTLMVLCLPMIKLVEKNLLSFMLRQVDDLRPEFITFNVEIFNALFVACCMQNATSIITNIGLAAVDFIMACISLRDLNQMLNEVYAIGAKANIQPAQFKEVALLISQQHPRLERRVTERVREERYASRGQSASQGSPERRWTAKTQPAPDAKAKFVHNTSTIAWNLALQHTTQTGASSTTGTRVTLTRVMPFPVSKEGNLPHAPSTIGPTDSTRPASVVDLMSEEDRVMFLQKTLQIWHLAEYMLLIEFTEVMIPIVYSLYLIVLFYLPNRAFYPQLKNMDNEKLHRTIVNVMLNAILEFLSLVILVSVVRKKLKSSPFRHLAFVLDRQSCLVQAKLVLWVVITLQSTLYHLGADYSFRFEWLRRKPERNHHNA